MDPQDVCGAATSVGTRIQQARQDTSPTDDNAGDDTAEKTQQSALRRRVSLDKMSLAHPGWQPSRKQYCSSAGCLLYDGSRVWYCSQWRHILPQEASDVSAHVALGQHS